jgi:hypothetical protein
MMFKQNQALIGLVAVLLASGWSETPVQSASAEAPSESTQSTESYGGTVQGVVTDSSGRPLAGAFVKLRNPKRRLTIMVVSKDEGRYTAQKLLPGSWVVQGVGGEFQSAWSAPVDVPTQGTVRADVSLTDRRAPMLAAAWPRRIPEEQATLASLPDGRGKEIIQARCVSCDEGTRIAANRVDRPAVADEQPPFGIHGDGMKPAELAATRSLLSPGFDEPSVPGKLHDPSVRLRAMPVGDENVAVRRDHHR